ncbi:MAG: hypothetical protein GDA43_25560 [Hormoscilla sp. SP5CHS1]|nr:hypothetical protein [Hormoscilla sp. SP5CHS1]
MLKTIVLVTKRLIVRSEFMEFIQKLGADFSNEDIVYDGQLYDRTGGYLWIKYNPEEELSGSELESRVKSITEKLGSSPQTQILIDIGKNRSSEILAAEFVTLFSRIWSCIIDDDNSILYSVPEFLEEVGWTPRLQGIANGVSDRPGGGGSKPVSITTSNLYRR